MILYSAQMSILVVLDSQLNEYAVNNRNSITLPCLLSREASRSRINCSAICWFNIFARSSFPSSTRAEINHLKWSSERWLIISTNFPTLASLVARACTHKVNRQRCKQTQLWLPNLYTCHMYISMTLHKDNAIVFQDTTSSDILYIAPVLTYGCDTWTTDHKVPLCAFGSYARFCISHKPITSMMLRSEPFLVVVILHFLKWRQIVQTVTVWAHYSLFTMWRPPPRHCGSSPKTTCQLDTSSSSSVSIEQCLASHKPLPTAPVLFSCHSSKLHAVMSSYLTHSLRFPCIGCHFNTCLADYQWMIVFMVAHASCYY